MKKRILIIGPAWVGDMMMAQVLFQLLHQHYPSLELHVLAPAWSEALLSRMPEVQRSIVLPFNHGELKLFARYQFAKTLRKMRYDQAIILPNSFKSALIPFWANIPIRTGFLGEKRYGLLNDYRHLNKKKLVSMVDRFATLAFSNTTPLPTHLPKPLLSVSANSVANTVAKFKLQLSQQPILILCPGAEFGSAKRWLPSYFADVAREKIKSGWVVWLMGSIKDQVIADEIQLHAHQQCVDLIGKTNLSEAVDLLSTASVVVSNDSGLMHIAAALARPVVALYGSTPVEFAPPLSENAVILKQSLDCQPCCQRECPLKHHHCMTLLLPKTVLNAIDSLHNGAP